MKSKLEYQLYEGSCFICFQPSQTNQIKSLSFLLNYLEIRDKLKAVVCEKCDKKLTKLSKLCETLKKISLEMDYLLDYIQSAISNSRNDFKVEPIEFNFVRESVMRKCRQEMMNPKPEILLEMVDISKFTKALPIKGDREVGRQIKRRKAQIILQKIDMQSESPTSSADCSKDLDLNWTDSNSGFSGHPDEFAVPVIEESIKAEVKFQTSTKNCEGHQKPSDYCQTPGHDRINSQTIVHNHNTNLKAKNPDGDPKPSNKKGLFCIQDKYLRKKENNNRAAGRYRKKLQDKLAATLKQVETLEALNEKLTTEKAKLETEIKSVRSLLRDKLWMRKEHSFQAPAEILPH